MFRRMVVASALAVALGIAFFGQPETAQAHGGWNRGWYGPTPISRSGYPVFYGGGGYPAAYHRLATPYPYVYTDYGLITTPVVVTPRAYGRPWRGYRNPGVSVFVGF